MADDIRIPVHKIEDAYFVIGRYPCICVHNDGVIVLFIENSTLSLRVDEAYVDRIKNIAIRDKGSLYVKVRPNGEGYILDEPLHK